MTKRLFALILTLLALGGCSDKNEIVQLLTPDRLYEKALLYTREDQIVEGLETKAAVSATLLNELFPDRYPYQEGVFFFVGIVTQLGVEDFKKNYHIILNGKEPLTITPVSTTDDLYKMMPNVNRWGRYFVVKFPKTSAKRFTLDFGVYPYGSVVLTFAKATPRR